MQCQRTTPSNRDRVLLKDLPLLVWQIFNQPNPFVEKCLTVLGKAEKFILSILNEKCNIEIF